MGANTVKFYLLQIKLNVVFRVESLKKPDRCREPRRSRIYQRGIRGEVKPTKGGWDLQGKVEKVEPTMGG